jgi:hypothetical protein
MYPLTNTAPKSHSATMAANPATINNRVRQRDHAHDVESVWPRPSWGWGAEKNGPGPGAASYFPGRNDMIVSRTTTLRGGLPALRHEQGSAPLKMVRQSAIDRAARAAEKESGPDLGPQVLRGRKDNTPLMRGSMFISGQTSDCLSRAHRSSAENCCGR